MLWCGALCLYWEAPKQGYIAVSNFNEVAEKLVVQLTLRRLTRMADAALQDRIRTEKTIACKVGGLFGLNLLSYGSDLSEPSKQAIRLAVKLKNNRLESGGVLGRFSFDEGTAMRPDDNHGHARVAHVTYKPDLVS